MFVGCIAGLVSGVAGVRTGKRRRLILVMDVRGLSTETVGCEVFGDAGDGGRIESRGRGGG